MLLCFRCSFTFCMSKSFTVLVLTFKPVIHLGLIFLYDIQYKEVHLILLHVDALLSQNHLLESCLFHLKIIWHACTELFLDSPIIHFFYMSVLMPVQYCTHYFSLAMSLKIRRYKVLVLLFVMVDFCLKDPLRFHKNYEWFFHLIRNKSLELC